MAVNLSLSGIKTFSMGFVWFVLTLSGNADDVETTEIVKQMATKIVDVADRTKPLDLEIDSQINFEGNVQQDKSIRIEDGKHILLYQEHGGSFDSSAFGNGRYCSKLMRKTDRWEILEFYSTSEPSGDSLRLDLSQSPITDLAFGPMKDWMAQPTYSEVQVVKQGEDLIELDFKAELKRGEYSIPFPLKLVVSKKLGYLPVRLETGELGGQSTTSLYDWKEEAGTVTLTGIKRYIVNDPNARPSELVAPAANITVKYLEPSEVKTLTERCYLTYYGLGEPGGDGVWKPVVIALALSIIAGVIVWSVVERKRKETP